MIASDKNEDGKGAEESCASRGRIVHLTTVHHPFDPRIFHKQLGSLSDAGYEAHLLAPHSRREEIDGVCIHPLAEVEGRIRRLSLQLSAWRIARRLRGDLYQIHDPELIPLAFFLRRVTERPVVYDMHENYRSRGPVLGRAVRALERWCFRWVDHVILAEQSYADTLEGSPVPYTIIENYFKPLERDGTSTVEERPQSPESPQNLLYTGTISKRRGLETMIDLATKLAGNGGAEKMTLVGICRYPEQRRKVEDRLQTENLNGVVERVGWDEYVPAAEMPPYYRRADVGLALCEPHPNLTGSLLTKFYEYLYYGMPIICSDFPLWRQFLEENECGVTVPPGDATAVADILDQWQKNPEVYRRLSQNARDAAPKYRWSVMGQRLVTVYDDLLRVSSETA